MCYLHTAQNVSATSVKKNKKNSCPCVTFSNRGVRELTITKLSILGTSHKCINAAQIKTDTVARSLEDEA